MNKRFVGVLLFAFLVASGASLLLYRLLINRPQTTKAAAPVTAHVVLATKDIEMGAILKEEDVKLEDWAGPVPPGAVLKIQDLVGRGVNTKIFAREPIIESRLSAKGAGGGLASMIPPGMRAVAIPVNEVVGVAGFVVAGMRVDVLISGQTPGSDSSVGPVTKTMLQNLEVLSAGQEFKKDAEGKPVAVPVINLLVTPDQAEQLSLASRQTTIQLDLRNPLDHDVAKTTGTALARLFDGTKAAKTNDVAGSRPAPRPRVAFAPVKQVSAQVVAAPKNEAPFVMEIISGTKKDHVNFETTPGGK
ncbi:MAG TPA: Flp pilus assembly protein CpaB [Candidatus Sulfopaludibacter sp.]|jgi:pilus assembly protein CpaB|nr:Flp pilus assembly protein CpaB [Candidatus Sulfopaludibacter sp.]